MILSILCKNLIIFYSRKNVSTRAGLNKHERRFQITILYEQTHFPYSSDSTVVNCQNIALFMGEVSTYTMLLLVKHPLPEDSVYVAFTSHRTAWMITAWYNIPITNSIIASLKGWPRKGIPTGPDESALTISPMVNKVLKIKLWAFLYTVNRTLWHGLWNYYIICLYYSSRVGPCAVPGLILILLLLLYCTILFNSENRASTVLFNQADWHDSQASTWVSVQSPRSTQPVSKSSTATAKLHILMHISYHVTLFPFSEFNQAVDSPRWIPQSMC